MATVEPLTGSSLRSTTHDREPGLGQRIGDHRAGDAGADDQHIGLEIAAEACMANFSRVAAFPDRASGAQISCFGDHGTLLRSSGL